MTLDPDRLMGLTLPARDVVYDDRVSILYALAVGIDRLDDAALPFLYEPGLKTLPTLATTLAFDDGWMAAGGIDLAQVVHGALDLKFHRPLARAGSVTVATRIAGLVDKGAGRGGLVTVQSTLAQEGAVACTLTSTLFVRGGGGFGGNRGEVAPDRPGPTGDPDRLITVPTAANQALLFRLLGDRNPLHIDPAAATAAGFPRPILHGACTFGIAGTAVLADWCGTDPARLKGLAARFAGPLLPGETLDFSFWRQADGVAFQAHARERGAIVLDAGFAAIEGGA